MINIEILIHIKTKYNAKNSIPTELVTFKSINAIETNGITIRPNIPKPTTDKGLVFNRVSALFMNFGESHLINNHNAIVRTTKDIAVDK